VSVRLPEDVVVLQRGWLSANNVVLLHGDAATLVDSGYVGHADQTLALLDHALAGRRLARLVNTHCHSDHMGGNARVKARHGCPIALPVGEAAIVRPWDTRALLLEIADQRADRFDVDETFDDGDVLAIGERRWQVIGAPGHDAHAVMFFDADARILISGDALWQNGFGVVFGALWDNPNALAETRATLDRIAALDARVVIPGHGPVFDDVEAALARAISRVEFYDRDRVALAKHCMKALFTYALLDRRSIAPDALPAYVEQVWILRDLNARFLGLSSADCAAWLAHDLVRSGAVRRQDGRLVPTIAA
jgi:glyoxylase-like metal-dependent hydrolase (beta-lactamase superfamily II)